MLFFVGWFIGWWCWCGGVLGCCLGLVGVGGGVVGVGGDGCVDWGFL